MAETWTPASMGRKGGKAGTGAAKRRVTGFDSERGRAAVEKRWGKRREKESQDAGSEKI